ncbi:MAG: hypothetical protein ACM3Q2_11585 [Syntrophothermus sp.]
MPSIIKLWITVIILIIPGIITAQNKSGKEMPAKKPKENTKEFVPAWAKDVVWYQIFPERFRNGDASNDPKL